MLRKLITLSILQVSFLFAQTQIAVVDFEALGVSSNDAKALTNRLMIELHRTNEFKVLEREMLDKIIEEQKFQLSGCNADQCLVRLGEIANVQQIVGGTISKVGEVFTITARLISVESGEVVASAIFDYEGNIGALMKTGMANVAAQLTSIHIPQGDTNNPQVITNQETIMDVDGNIYKTIKIGGQVWMAENLKVTHYRNGDAIPFLKDNDAWASTSSGAYCYYDSDFVWPIVFGHLYNSHAVFDNRGLAPEGWHVPTDEDWIELEIALGMSQEESNKLGWHGTNQGSKLSGDTNLWKAGQLIENAGFGISDFNALPGGYRYDSDGHYEFIGEIGFFWASTEYGGNYPWSRRIYFEKTEIARGHYYRNYGFSVRCIKN
jgi:uncharacterized protein (TIGR02145 family)